MTTYAVPAAAGRVVDVEWPPGSGRVAGYDADERLAMRCLMELREARKITRAELLAQIGVLHDVKVEFGVSIAQTA